MLVIFWDKKDITKDCLKQMGIHGEEIGGLPIPDEVRLRADELGCFSGLASIVNKSNGRISFVGVWGECRKTQRIGEYL